MALALFMSGRDVVLVDDRRPGSGSAPSGCLMKPSWFSSLGKNVYDPALDLLSAMFGVDQLWFKIRPSGVTTSAFHIPAKKILCCHGYHEEYGTVTGFFLGGAHVSSHDGTMYTLEAPLIVVAAGVWCSELMQVDGLIGKKGVSFRAEGKVTENHINVWAPYKQLVVFQEDDNHVWGGDGAAIKPDNWTKDRESDARRRVIHSGVLKVTSTLKATTGIRPYIAKVKPCLLEQRAPGLWLCTGGAKNGTIAAGWAASEILRRLS